MITSLCWVPKGAAKPVPDRTYDSDDDAEMIEDSTGGEGPSEVEKATQALDAIKSDEIDKAYNLQTYDQEQGGIFGVLDANYYPSNKLDPNLTTDDLEDKEMELEDLRILDSDGLLIAATTDTDLSHLAFYVFEESENNTYIHHDVLLGAYPLSLAWMDINPKNHEAKGSFVAVGTFDPGIEIFDLDVVDSLEPVATLGGTVEPKTKDPRKLRRRMKRPRMQPNSHAPGGVMALSWNKKHRTLLASGGADSTVKLWDVTTQKCMHTYTHHKDKVQSVEWHPVEGNVMVTGSYDGTVTVFDATAPQAMAKWTLSSDVESIKWDPHHPKQFFISQDNGKVLMCTIDMPGKPVYTLEAHEDKAATISVNPVIPNFLATISMDKSYKLWDLTDNRPNCIHAQELSLGKLFSGTFYESSPFVLALGGKKQLQIVDTYAIDSVKEIFGKYRRPSAEEAQQQAPTEPSGEKGL